MPAVKSQTVTNPLAPGAQLIWQQIRAQLESTQQRIIGEISNYPAPRPACDADFNHLLEERARISDELNRLHAAADTAPEYGRQQIEEFVETSQCLDNTDKRQIKLLISKLPR